MHPFFEPLDERETMLLLTTLTVGGSERGHLRRSCRPTSRDKLRTRRRRCSPSQPRSA